MYTICYTISVFENNDKKSYFKFDQLTWPDPIPGDHDFVNIDSSLPMEPSSQLTAFLSKGFWRR